MDCFPTTEPQTYRQTVVLAATTDHNPLAVNSQYCLHGHPVARLMVCRLRHPEVAEYLVLNQNLARTKGGSAFHIPGSHLKQNEVITTSFLCIRNVKRYNNNRWSSKHTFNWSVWLLNCQQIRVHRCRRRADLVRVIVRCPLLPLAAPQDCCSSFFGHSRHDPMLFLFEQHS